MAALSEGTLATLLRNAGFPEEKVPLMVNIAKRESGLRPGAHNPNAATGDNSYGLFQINMIGNLGPARLKEYADIGVKSYEDLKDPWKNVQAAKKVFDSQGLGAWTTYQAALKDPKPALSGGSAAELPAIASLAVDEGAESSPLSSALASILKMDGAEAEADAPRSSKAMSGDFLGRLEAIDPGAAAQVAAVTALLPRSAPAAQDAAAVSAASAMPQQQAVGDGGELDIVTLGKQLQGLGLKVAENPAFGGVGKHSPNSHHYAGHAVDLTIQPGSPLLKGRPDSEWRALTKQLGAQLKAAIPGAEIFHPGDDPVGGHDSHIHLALPGGRTKITPALAQLLRM